jgi:predicted nuclease of predicted toxin-antitoxin system
MLRFFLDANVARSVGEVLEEAGHFVIYGTQALPEKTPDQMVCAASLANDCILVAHDKDMKAMSQLDKFKKLNFLLLYCNEVIASKRVAHLMTLIEHEGAACAQLQARRFFLEIHAHAFRSHR